MTRDDQELIAKLRARPMLCPDLDDLNAIVRMIRDGDLVHIDGALIDHAAPVLKLCSDIMRDAGQ